MDRREKALEVMKRLKVKHRPRHNRGDPFHVLVGTILSQRTRDEKTDLAAERLFSVYDTPGELAGADRVEVEGLIRPAGFYRQKAAKIIEVARIVHEEWGDEVPGDHSVRFESPAETLVLSHSVADRGVFAAGALRAASWVIGAAPGLYTMRDVLCLTK